MRRFTLGLLVAFACVGATGALPPELRRAAAVAENDHRGIVSFEITWDTEARGGPIHQRFHYRNAYVYDGTRLIGARALEKVDNGRTGGQADLDAQTKRILDENHAPDAAGFAVPFDSRHFEEYRFDRAPCDTTCLDGDTAIGFTALINDADHGDGHLIIDRDGHVRHLDYVPRITPAFGGVHARNALVTIDRAPVLPGFWATTKIESHYSGRYGFITGEATQTTRFDRYHRYRNAGAALSALELGAV